MTYDFFLPGLVIDALARTRRVGAQAGWIRELVAKQIRTVNMLGCHDGIPLLDLKGLLDDEHIEAIIETVKGRGGYVKDLHGAKNIYYQVNATYYSALGSSDAAMLLARAIQLFTPGKPQVWYLDLFAGRNDHEAVERAGAGRAQGDQPHEPQPRGRTRGAGPAGRTQAAGAPEVPERVRCVRLRRFVRGRRDPGRPAADHVVQGRPRGRPRGEPRDVRVHDHRRRSACVSA
jgi:hypothetical protein